MKYYLGALLAVLVLGLNQVGLAVEIGSKAPDFSLGDIYGKSHTLSNYRGKYVVLEWTNYGCPFVQKFYNSGTMQKLQQQWTEKDVIWLTICSSAPGEQGNMSPEQWQTALSLKKVHATATLLDPDGRVGHLYTAKTTPDMYVINPEGILIYCGAIDSIPSTNQADLAKAKNYVNAALSESMAGKAVSVPTSKSYGCSVKYKP